MTNLARHLICLVVGHLAEPSDPIVRRTRTYRRTGPDELTFLRSGTRIIPTFECRRCGRFRVERVAPLDDPPPRA